MYRIIIKPTTYLEMPKVIVMGIIFEMPTINFIYLNNMQLI